MKTYWKSGDIAPYVLKLGTRWRWVVSVTPRPLFSSEIRDFGVHWIGDCVGSKAGIDAAVKTAPARNPVPVVKPVAESIYWRSYSAICKCGDV
jgi:hypothetical protein